MERLNGGNWATCFVSAEKGYDPDPVVGLVLLEILAIIGGFAGCPCGPIRRDG